MHVHSSVPSTMIGSPQDVYARNLLSHHGYPLRTPEPSIKLPDCYRREGLKIGDVSVVVPEDGSFDVYFNLTLPREHPLHAAHGVPDNFTLQRRNYRVLPNAEVLVVPFLLLLWSARLPALIRFTWMGLAGILSLAVSQRPCP